MKIALLFSVFYFLIFSRGLVAQQSNTSLSIGVGTCDKLQVFLENPQQIPDTALDQFAWLEEINSGASLEWIQNQNKKTQDILEASPRYKTYYEQLLKIFSGSDKLIYPGFRVDEVHNIWQDNIHKLGIWRRASISSYLNKNPNWEILLDLDKISQEENKQWVWKRAHGLPNFKTSYLVYLSDGGSDAVEIREFNADKKEFVTINNFFLPCQKQNVEWLDSDTLIVGRDWQETLGESTLTHSGYPYVLKLLKRGQSLDEAQEIFRGNKTDIITEALVFHDKNGTLDALLAIQAFTYYDFNYYIFDDKYKPTKLALPPKMHITGYSNNQLIFTIQQDWGNFKMGDLLSCNLKALKSNPTLINAQLIMRPAKNQAIDEIAATRDYLIVKGLEDVKSFVDIYSFTNNNWTASRVDLPKDTTITLTPVDKNANYFCVLLEGFLSPTKLLLIDAETQNITTLQELPHRFDNSRHTVEQHWVQSSDGTRIPYFIVLPKDIQLDGSTPTLLYGYGGFQISILPAYLPEMGTCWLEQGGAYVVANIRGGGEFGPDWHKAALKDKRQLAFDDFAAVAQDLIARKITSPQKLGIYGRSNGGVLTSVFMTQHPELCNAVVIEAPLVDMLRYNKLLAGASWVGEYGDPDNPAEREFIQKYSAYQNLKHKTKYPEVYITASIKDDRVHPAHARKFAAKLQAMGYPCFYYENLIGGHTSSIDPQSAAQRWARHYSYLAYKLISQDN